MSQLTKQIKQLSITLLIVFSLIFIGNSISSEYSYIGVVGATGYEPGSSGGGVNKGTTQAFTILGTDSDPNCPNVDRPEDIDTMRKCLYGETTNVCGGYISGAEGNRTPNQDQLNCRIKHGLWVISDIPLIITRLSSFLLQIVGLVCVLFVLIGGYMLVASGASEGMKTTGKNTITNALLGLVISILSWTIVQLILYLVTT